MIIVPHGSWIMRLARLRCHTPHQYLLDGSTGDKIAGAPLAEDDLHEGFQSRDTGDLVFRRDLALLLSRLARHRGARAAHQHHLSADPVRSPAGALEASGTGGNSTETDPHLPALPVRGAAPRYRISLSPDPSVQSVETAAPARRPRWRTARRACGDGPHLARRS